MLGQYIGHFVMFWVPESRIVLLSQCGVLFFILLSLGKYSMGVNFHTSTPRKKLHKNLPFCGI